KCAERTVAARAIADAMSCVADGGGGEHATIDAAMPSTAATDRIRTFGSLLDREKEHAVDLPARVRMHATAERLHRLQEDLGLRVVVAAGIAGHRVLSEVARALDVHVHHDPAVEHRAFHQSKVRRRREA